MRVEGSRESKDPYLRFALAEFVDVGISEHTVKVCAMPHERSNSSTRSLTHTSSQDSSAVWARLPFAGSRRFVMVKGLGTAIYHVPDLDRAKAWYSAARGRCVPPQRNRK